LLRLPIETIVATPAELAQTFAARLTSTAERVQATGRALSLVLPGGSVAEIFFPVLALAAIDWTMVEVFWSDERAVPPDDEDSNYRMADELLLRRVAIDRARIHRMEADAADLCAAARQYEAKLARAIGTPPHFDVVLLGVGPDGHVCSLFPGHRALEETVRHVVAVTDSPKPPPARLTLTLAALAGAEVYIAAFGPAKAAVVGEALTNLASRLPVARAARTGRAAVFLLDGAAAGRKSAID
jgi:6-phosphogluconolactonase